MKIWKRTLALLLCLVLTVSLCACGSAGGDVTASVSPDAGGSQDPDASVSPDAEGSRDPDADSSIPVDLTQDAVAFATGLSGGDVLLTVNGEDIPADLFLYLLYQNCDWFMYQYYYSYWSVPESLEPVAQALLDDTVNMAAHYAILHQRAAELGCLPTEAQVQEALDRLLSQGQERYDSLKAAYGLSDKSMDYISTISCYYTNLLDALVPEATEEMLNGYVYQVKHILLSTVDHDTGAALDEDTVTAQRALAEDILARLQAVEGEARSALFDELMNQYSEDGRDENGELYAPDGYTAVPGDMVSEFEEASLALPIGGLSGIVESSYGYHIILRGEVDDFEDYIEGCREYQLDSELDALTQSAQITRSAALDALDVDSFYERYYAYQTAFAEKYGNAVS